ncbi:MAG: PspA/IM30 family protein [Cellulosilyticaceae bacterium]
MSIFGRIGDLFKANVNDMLDKAEDPEKMIKQSIIDMEKQVTQATQALGQAMASEKAALNTLEKAKSTSAEWEEKAKMALKAGNQELAKKALEGKVSADQNISAFQTSYDTMHSQVVELRSRVETLRAKLEEARSQQNILIARARTAEAQKDIAQAISGTDSSSAFSKLEKMERKIEEKEAQAQAFSDISSDTTFAKDEFKELEKNSAVDAEFARLMQEMNTDSTN